MSSNVPSPIEHASLPSPVGSSSGAVGPASAPASDEIDLREVWGIVRRNWPLILGCFAAAVGLGWLATSRMTPVYQAEATLRIDDGSQLPALEILQSLGGDGKSEVATEMEVLRSRSLAAEVVDSLDLRVQMTAPRGVRRSEVIAAATVADTAPAAVYRFERSGAGEFAVTTAERNVAFGVKSIAEPVPLPGVVLQFTQAVDSLERFELEVLGSVAAIDALLEELTVSRPNRDAAIVAVKYRGSDPVLVREVPNVLVHAFITRRLEVKKTGATSTVAFLRGQLDTITAQLRRSEERLRAFREAEQIVSLETEAGAQVENLAELQAQRNAVHAEYAALQAVVNATTAGPEPEAGEPSPYRKLLAFPTLFRNPAVSELLSTLTELDNRRSALLQRRTPADPDVVYLDRMIADVEAQVRALVLTYMSGLDRQVAALDETLERFGKRLEAIPAKEVEFARLRRDARVLSEIHTMLQTKLKESEIAEAVDDPSVRPVDLAYLPVEPVAPRMPLNLMLSGLLGLMLGGAAAFGREWMDTAVHTREDVRRATGAPVLGLIPHIKGAALPKYRLGLGRGASPEREASSRALALVAGRAPQSVVAEAYRTLRTNLTFARPDRPPKVLVFTSAAPSDGKTTSVANLAATLAQQGLKVLVIDADMRRGFLHRVFGAVREPGLSDLLIGRIELTDAIQDVELGGGRVHVIATGPLPPNPAELLGSERMRSLLDRLDSLYDAVLVDAPPVNVVTDAAVAGRQADGVVLVARAAKTGRDELRLAMEQLRTVRVPVVGTVLNDFDARRDSRYGGGYYYGAGYSISTPRGE